MHEAPRSHRSLGHAASDREAARFLVGAGAGEAADGSPPCAIVDVGHRRALDLGIELPSSDLRGGRDRTSSGRDARRLAALVRAHRTTLVFVNTRRMAERVAHQLAERLGDDAVAAHHGSLVEGAPAAGRAALRPASCARSSRRRRWSSASTSARSTWSARSARRGASRPSCSASGARGTRWRARRKGASSDVARRARRVRGAGRRCPRRRARSVHPPVLPLDILAQQIVAECAAASWSEDELFDVVRRAAPFADLTREDFDASSSWSPRASPPARPGRRAPAPRPHQRRGARAGAARASRRSPTAAPSPRWPTTAWSPIPTTRFVGTVNEDWAIESMAGDMFLLGSHSWRIRRVDRRDRPRGGRARRAADGPVLARRGAGAHVGALARGVGAAQRSRRAARGGRRRRGVTWVEQRSGVDNDVAAMVVRYLAAQPHRARRRADDRPRRLRALLRRERRHAARRARARSAARVNRAFGLALRKRFCATFDFELQAAATDDAIVLSLGTAAQLPAARTFRTSSRSNTLDEMLRKAAILGADVRHALALEPRPRARGAALQGRARSPAPLQRMRADDLMAAVFPQLVACQDENPTGPVEPPDHPLVHQTMHDCLHEAMDVDRLRELRRAHRAAAVGQHAQDTTEPSPLAHEILNAKPYAFLDDAPLEERRSRAITLRRTLPVKRVTSAHSTPTRSRACAARRALSRATPTSCTTLLVSLVVTRPVAAWRSGSTTLVERGRALTRHERHGRRSGAPPSACRASRRSGRMRRSSAPAPFPAALAASPPRSRRHGHRDPSRASRGDRPASRRRHRAGHRARRNRHRGRARDARGRGVRHSRSVRPRASTTSSGARAACSPASTATRSSASVRRSSRSARGLHALPAPLAARRPGHAAGGSRGCRRDRSRSCRASRSPRRCGRRRSCPAASPGIAARGSTSCACRARSHGLGCGSATMPTGARSQRSSATGVARHPGHARDALRPSLAPPVGPR